MTLMTVMTRGFRSRSLQGRTETGCVAPKTATFVSIRCNCPIPLVRFRLSVALLRSLSFVHLFCGTMRFWLRHWQHRAKGRVNFDAQHFNSKQAALWSRMLLNFCGDRSFGFSKISSLLFLFSYMCVYCVFATWTQLRNLCQSHNALFPSHRPPPLVPGESKRRAQIR